MATCQNAEIDFSKIRVKPVTDYFERADVETLLSRCHPLGATPFLALVL